MAEQRFDIIVDGKVINTNQRLNNAAVIKRIQFASRTATRILLRKHDGTMQPDHSVPTPATPPVAASKLQSMAQNVVFFADVTNEAINEFIKLPPHWKFAVTADPNPAYAIDQATIDRLSLNHHLGFSWCDCSATAPSYAIAMAKKYNLAGWIGQAENQSELDVALGAGAIIIIANPNAWNDSELDPAEKSSARTLVDTDAIAVIGEIYDVNPAYSAQGIQVASLCLGIGLDKGLYIPVTNYIPILPGINPKLATTYGVYHGSALRTEDWTILRNTPAP